VLFRVGVFLFVGISRDGKMEPQEWSRWCGIESEIEVWQRGRERRGKEMSIT
jgi:hypothetical protein